LTICNSMKGHIMNANIGTADQRVRVIIGFLLVAASLFGVIGLWGFLGIVLLVTGLYRTCPAYRLIGFSTSATR
jgi:hypothetical protein